MKKYIYVAGPYSSDPCRNTHAAIQAAEQLIAFGYVPFVPHLTHFWHTMTPHDYEFWLEYDLAWLRKCDAVLRLPGESKGADRECGEAMSLGIPVFHSIDDLRKHFIDQCATSVASELSKPLKDSRELADDVIDPHYEFSKLFR